MNRPGQREQVWVNSRNAQLAAIADGEFPPRDPRGGVTRVAGGAARTDLAEDEMYVLTAEGVWVVVDFDNTRDHTWSMTPRPGFSYDELKERYESGAIDFPRFMYEYENSDNYLVALGPADSPGRNEQDSPTEPQG
ncbi:hypothetical protein GCM10022261_22790 [Brevibacterium daeguense]|uniref:ASCH domain-containing protein n=1 Tax=Brevibacterium daeguense TaxID=909936 RepID=A0ABP8ELB4_9MICO|nr:HNH/ENDO VII family nuclease [Brevibacterium daeguense]